MKRVAWVGFVCGFGVMSGPAWSQEIRTPPPISGRSIDGGSINAADVLARVRLLQAHLESIRTVMGRPAPPPPLIHGENVAVRETVIMALNVERRVARLAYEQLRADPEWQKLPPQDPTHTDVFESVNRSLLQVLQVRDALGIEEEVRERPASDGAQPADVFDALVAVGSLVNALLIQQSSPGDTFVGVTLGVHVALQMHLVLVDTPMPQPPEPVPPKTSADVFQRLLELFDLVERLAQRAGRQVLRLQIERPEDRTVTADDVSNLVALLLSELLWLHGLVEGAEAPVRGYSAGQKFPSDVYRRAGLLKLILQDLVERGDVDHFSKP